MMQDGLSERQAAKAEGIPRSTLRSYRKRNTKSWFRNGHWQIADKRPQPMYIVSKGEVRTIVATDRTASVVGRYWNAVNAYLDTNRRSYLRRFDGVRVRDYGGKYYVLETDPSVLRKLDAIGDFDFKEIYAQGSVGGGHG
jgi:hypothetical protein